MNLNELPVSEDLLVVQLEQVKLIAGSWAEEISERRIPGIHVPPAKNSAELELEVWARRFCGEIMLAARQLETLADLVSGSGL